MYIYYVYTTKSIGSKSVTRRLRKKKQRYKIPSQSARDLKTNLKTHRGKLSSVFWNFQKKTFENPWPDFKGEITYVHQIVELMRM